MSNDFEYFMIFSLIKGKIYWEKKEKEENMLKSLMGLFCIVSTFKFFLVTNFSVLSQTIWEEVILPLGSKVV